MKYSLKIINKNDEDFNRIRENGFGGVIFTENLLSKGNLETAKKKKLMTFLHISDLSRESCFYLDSTGVKKGDLYAVTIKSAKNAVKRLGDRLDIIDGFVIPVPILKGLLWNEAVSILYEDFCGRDIKYDMPAIFDKYAEDVDLRVWYYKTSAEVLFLEYIIPMWQYFAALGKKACFDFGRADKGIELIKKQLNPFWFQKTGIPVIYESDKGISLICGREMKKPNLLVLPFRAVMLNYAYGAKYSRQESALVLTLADEEYYKNSLKKCKIDYKAVDEVTFSNMKKGQLEEFENILICNCCALTNDDKDRIAALKKAGCKINEKTFLDMLDREN